MREAPSEEGLGTLVLKRKHCAPRLLQAPYDLASPKDE
jgi:hypothetical protein